MCNAFYQTFIFSTESFISVGSYNVTSMSSEREIDYLSSENMLFLTLGLLIFSKNVYNGEMMHVWRFQSIIIWKVYESEKKFISSFGKARPSVSL